eukprot:7205457-Prymnesium_polylepis.2
MVEMFGGSTTRLAVHRKHLVQSPTARAFVELYDAGKLDEISKRAMPPDLMRRLLYASSGRCDIRRTHS